MMNEQEMEKMVEGEEDDRKNKSKDCTSWANRRVKIGSERYEEGEMSHTKQDY